MQVFNSTEAAIRHIIETNMTENCAIEHDRHVTFVLGGRTYEVDYVDVVGTLDEAAAEAAAGEIGCEVTLSPTAASAAAAIRLLDRVAPAAWGGDPVEEAARTAWLALYATSPLEWGDLFAGPMPAGRWYAWDGGRASVVPTWDVPSVDGASWAEAEEVGHVPAGDTVLVRRRYRPIDGDRVIQVLDGVATPFIYRAP